MRGLTRLPYRGRLIRLGKRADDAPSRRAGVVATACTQGKRTQHGKPRGGVSDDQPDAREGRSGRHGVTERQIYREDILAHAYAQCRSNRGTPGVDGQDFGEIEAYGMERWLGELALALRQESYRPDPIRRVFIPKANG